MSKPRPNLFIIGAMKSGTSSLHVYLDNHPQIFMCKPKEPMFFSRESNWSKGEKEYLELFASARDAMIIGDSSTEYSKAPKYSGVPERIAQFNPEARFIYIMRDPVKRVISQYWHMAQKYNERRDMLTAIKEDSEYIAISHYAMQLSLYFKVFGRDKVAILTLEELRKNTVNVVKKLFEWLGVDSSFTPLNLNQRENITPSNVLWQEHIVFYHLRRASCLKPVKSLIPQPMLSLAKKASGRYIDSNSVSVDSVVDFLKPIQTEQVAALSEMLGRDFPEWTTLYSN